MKFEIEDKLASVILNYLATKPYNEVAGMIAELQRMKKVEEKKEASDGK